MKHRTFGLEFECISKKNWADIAQGLAKLGIVVDTYATGQASCRNGCYSGWQVKTDGSITSSDEYPCGVELVSPPLTRNDLHQARMALHYMRNFARVNSSCGLHVHVGVPELRGVLSPNMRDWGTHVKNCWESVEPVLFNYKPPSRRNGHYCHKGVDWGRKYSAFNVSGLSSTRATIEFRLHNATLSFRKAISFAMLCVAFVDKLIESGPTGGSRGNNNRIKPIDPKIFKPPKPHIVKNGSGEFYVHRTKAEWIIEKGSKTLPFPDLLTAFRELRHELCLESNLPGHALHFAVWGNGMSELWGQISLNGRFRSFLEERYDSMTKKHGFVDDMLDKVTQEDDDSFYNEEELMVPPGVRSEVLIGGVNIAHSTSVEGDQFIQHLTTAPAPPPSYGFNRVPSIGIDRTAAEMQVPLRWRRP